MCPEYSTRYLGTWVPRRLCGGAGLTGITIGSWTVQGWTAARIMSQVLDVVMGEGERSGGERSRKWKSSWEVHGIQRGSKLK